MTMCKVDFFYVVNQLSTDWNATEFKKAKVTSVKYNIDKVKECLLNFDVEGAKRWLHRVLPYG